MHAQPRAPGSRLSRPPRWLLLIIAVYLAYAVAYAAVLPPLEGFDSFAHFNYANYLLGERKLPAIDSAAAKYSYELPQQPPLYYAASAAAVALSPADYSANAEWTRASENPYQQSLSPRWSVTLPNTPSGFVLSAQIARMVTVLGGLLGVIGTALLAQRIFPGQNSLQALITAIVAFNPLYSYLTVAISNDAWAVGGVAMSLWLLARAVTSERMRYGRWLAFGMAFGLASLTKYSALLIGPAAAVAVIPLLRRYPLRTLVLAGSFAFIGALATAGFWHGRNLLVYGELAPLHAMSEAIPTLLRPTPMSAGEIVQTLPMLLRTYWGVYVGADFTAVYYTLMLAFAIGGIVLALAWVVRGHWRTREAFVLLCAGVCSLTVAVGMVMWLRSVRFSGQARLLLVAAPAIAILIGFGWRAWLPERWRRVSLPALGIGLAVLPLLPLPALAQDMEMPRVLGPQTTMQHVFKANYADGMQITGATFDDGATLLPGATLPVTVFFRANKPIETHYTLFMQLVDESGHKLWQFDGVPFDGRHPTRQWRPGELFADHYAIGLQPGAVTQPVMAQLVAGFYPISAPSEPATAYDGDGREIGRQVVLGKVRILPQPADEGALQPAQAEWVNGIRLIADDIVLRADGKHAVRLAWQTTHVVDKDLTVFVHYVDAQGQILAQSDRQPLNGDIPTTVWLPGEIVRDEAVIDLPDEAPWARVQVGFYDGETGARVPLKGGDDVFVLATR